MRAFATDGYTSASLRDIAKAAGCSLTLLVHHFGNKAGLLTAVVRQQQALSELRLSALRAELAAADLDFKQLATSWSDYEFGQSRTREGKLYLSVILRLQSDRDVDENIRRTLNSSEPVVIKGLARVRPTLSDDSRRSLWLMASAALYAAVTGVDHALEPGGIDAQATLRSSVAAFLANGFHGYSTHATT